MTVPSMIRTRWAAIGAAVAVSLGAGGIGLIQATSPDGASAFVPITPCRIFDTRPEFQVGPRSAPLATNDTHNVAGRGSVGQCTIPDSATGLALNVTALDASLPTFLTVWPTGETLPTASSLNPSPGQPPTPNAVTTNLGTDGQFSIYNLQGTVHVLADVVGYYTDHDHDDRYYTESEVDSAFSDKANTADVYTKTESDARYLEAPTGSVTVALADFSIDEGQSTRWSFGGLWNHAGYESAASYDCIQADPELPSGADVQSVELLYIRNLPPGAATTTTSPGDSPPEEVSVLVAQVTPTVGPVDIAGVVRVQLTNQTVLPETGAQTIGSVTLLNDPAAVGKAPIGEDATNQFIQICGTSKISLARVTVNFTTP